MNADLLHDRGDPLGLWKADGSGPFVPPQAKEVDGCALLFEGGGMRASYTSAAVVTLLEQGVLFPFVCGVSAGSSNLVNYLNGDPWRARVSFTDIVLDPRFGGMLSMLQGKGYFSAKWLYEEAGLPGNAIPYGFGRLLDHPAEFAIQALDAVSGETVVWGRPDVRSLRDLMVMVRASSTVPFMMPPPSIEGRVMFDGGLGTGGGLALQAALDAGYERVFAVLTRPRGYRKGKPDGTQRMLAGLWGRKYPGLAKALLTRNARYNAELERLEHMAAEGKAFLVYADAMAVGSSETDPDKLRTNYLCAYDRYRHDWPNWVRWLGI